jgi:collagenase-like PrtC family protease
MLNIRANVLVNASCLGDGYHDRTPLLQHIAALHDVGVHMVTVADLSLASSIRSHIPDMELSASTTALVNSAVKAALWRDACDVDDICPDRDVNKRPSILRAIRSAAPRARIRLLVNDHCLPDCAARMNCMNSIAHESPRWADTYLTWCSGIKAKRPWVAYSNSLIVPANLSFYESSGLVDVVKIQGRQAASSYIAALVRHYLSDSRRYDPFDDSADLEEPTGVFRTVSRCARNCHECNIADARKRGYENWCHMMFSVSRAERASGVNDRSERNHLLDANGALSEL